MEGVEKKKPLSRKKQLAELKKARKARKIEAGQTAGNCDPDYEPGQEVEEARHAEGELAEMEVEQPGEAAGRERNKQRQRLHRERVRGLGAGSSAMHAWLASSNHNQHILELEEERAVADECAAGAVAEAVAAWMADEKKIEEAAEARRKREQRAAKKRSLETSTPPARAPRPRLSRTFASEGSDGARGRKRQHSPTRTPDCEDEQSEYRDGRRRPPVLLTKAMANRILRIDTNGDLKMWVHKYI